MSFLKLKLEPKIKDYFLDSSKHYSMGSLTTFLEYFFMPDFKYNLVDNNADIAVWDIQQDNESLMSSSELNMMICLENCNFYKNYKHFNKFGNYGNSKINIYFYNHITKLQQTENFIAIPMIHVFINYFQKHYQLIQPSKMVPFQDKKFCLVINRSGLNPHLKLFRQVLEHLGKVDDISQFDSVKNSSCYHSVPLLNLFQEYKFILCLENSHDPGYITEKIFNCFYARTIPLYAGSQKILDYIHPESFIHLLDNPRTVMQKIKSIMENESLYASFVNHYPIINENFNYMFPLKNFIEKRIQQKKISIYYINLLRREDRNSEFLEKVEKTNLFSCPISRYDGIDGTQLEQELITKGLANDIVIGALQHELNRKNSSMQKPVLACFLSHYFLLKKILKECSTEMVLIFEDDVFFSKNNFTDIFKEIQDFKEPWDIMYLGGRWEPNFVPNGDWEYFEKKTETLYKRLQTNELYLEQLGKNLNLDRGAMGYLINTKSIKKILHKMINFIFVKPFQAIDAIYVGLDLDAYDYFPHVFYSPIYYNKSDIQLVSQKEKNYKVAYIDFWQDYSNLPVTMEAIKNPESWNQLLKTRELSTVKEGVGLFHKNNLEKILDCSITITKAQDADFIICSGFGYSRFLYPQKKKICLVYEADFSIMDKNLPNTLYFSSSLTKDPTHFYLPLYICYHGFSVYQDLQKISIPDISNRKSCCSIISNKKCSFRNEFLKKLSEKIDCDNYGKLQNNIKNEMVENSSWFNPKLASVIGNYKFMICMENVSQEGYHTEKIMLAFINNVIPVYWGDSNISKIFNPQRFLDVATLGIEKTIEKITSLCNDNTEYLKMLQEPIIHTESILNNSINQENFIHIIKNFIK
jgi:GR25 family glycosyltransferase involved in LPS biosynthesis